MKTFSSASAILGLTLTGLTIATTVSAEPFSVVYDTDGKYRSTTYNGSFIERITTTSDSARNLQFHLYPSNDFTGTCVSANAYDIETGTHISNAPIRPLGVSTNALVVNLQIDEAYLQKDKTIAMHCYDNNGNTVQVQHKVPGAPSIEWKSSLQGNGPWTSAGYCEGPDCPQGSGSYESLSYSATIQVNNHTSQARCHTKQDAELEIPLLNGKDFRKDFYSDSFITPTTQISQYSPPVIVQSISCVNSGGTTKALQVWDVTNEDFVLIEDISYSY